MQGSFIVIYDHECPICSNYMLFKERQHDITLISARDKNKYQHLKQSINGLDRYNINNGFIVIYENKIYQGSAAIKILAVDKGFEKIISRFMRFVIIEKFIYFLAKKTRLALLTVKGIKRQID